MHEISFDCHNYLDNKTLSILEISTGADSINAKSETFHWLLIEKSSLKVTQLEPSPRNDPQSAQERYFDLGYLKYDLSTGTFICQQNDAVHPLEKLTCKAVPETLLKAVESYLNTNQNSTTINSNQPE